MKHILYIIMVITTLCSCERNPSIKSNDDAGINDNVNDTIAIDTTWTVTVGIRESNSEMLILYTDSNNVSVFDSLGKNWSKSDFVIVYPRVTTAGSSTTITYRYREGTTHYLIPLQFTPGRNSPWGAVETPWLLLQNNLNDTAGIRTFWLHMPDKTVDTIRTQVRFLGKRESGINSIHNIWYNGELKYSGDSIKPGVGVDLYPDGSIVANGPIFQIIK